MDTKHITPKAVVTVKRMWHSPEVHAFIDHAEVGARMSATDFVRALAAEVGNPTFIMSNAALEAKLLAAADAILAEMKQATAAVV